MTGKDDSLAAASEASAGGVEWPVPKPVVDFSPGASECAPAKPDVFPTLPTGEEATLQAVLQMQYRILESFGEFLARTEGSDGDEADEEDDGVAEDGGLEESEEYKFLLGVFIRERELRGYYEENYASGDFCCFVCGGDKRCEKKTFNSCEGLLQHSILTAKTTGRQAHRALGLVICKVLGWDFGRLPVIVVEGKPLSQSLASLGDIQCEIKENLEVSEDVSPVVVSELLQCKSEETVAVKKEDASEAHSSELQCENVEIADTDKNILVVASSSVEKVNVNHKNGEREDGWSSLSKKKPLAQTHYQESKYFLDTVPSGGEWPRQKITVSTNSALREWPNLPSASSNLPVSAEEVAKTAAEQKVLKACQDFFHCEYGSESDHSEADEDDLGAVYEDEDEDDGCEDRESKESAFFIKLFMEDAKLRTYYEKCHGDGDFLCLVCAGVGKKTWRRFKGCIGLLHHSNTVWKTKKKAHRAYARTVCKVLGWDIDQFPKIVHIAEPLNSSLVDSTTMLDSVSANSSGAGWPCEDIKNGSQPQTSEWPNLKLTSDLVNDSVSAEEEVKVAAEQKILEACRDFFSCKYRSGYDEDESEDKVDLMDEEEEEDEDEDGESEEFKFFMKLFTENANLRSYYEKSHGDGDFLCLVCGAVKKKTWRRFKGCSGLLLHSNSIWKVKKKAHRAYARAVCKILRWDVERLPRIVSISEPLGQSIADTQDSVPLPASDVGWPCGDIVEGPNSSKSEWPNLKLPLDSVSADEKEKLAAEQKVLQACRNFFCSKYGPELDEDDDDEEGNDSMDEDDDAQDLEAEDKIMGGDPCQNNEEFKFFIKLFTEDEKLRSFYVNNRGSGDFRCLVCAAVGKKDWKRFKGCVGLLNHSNTVLKTKIKAHRAYARAVCAILGWDIEQSWRIATVSEPLGQSLANSDDVQDQVKANADEVIHRLGQFRM